MSYRVSILRQVQKELGNLPAGAFERVQDAPELWQRNPVLPSIKSSKVEKVGTFEWEIIEFCTRLMTPSKPLRWFILGIVRTCIGSK